MFVFYVSLLLNTDVSNKFYVLFWGTTFIYLLTSLCLFIGFYKSSDSALCGPSHLIYQFAISFASD